MRSAALGHHPTVRAALRRHHREGCPAVLDHSSFSTSSCRYGSTTRRTVTNQGVATHVRVDGRLGLHPTPAIELSLALQDLWDDHHLEFGRPDRVTPTEMERSIYDRLTLRL
jgi:hypothetical protein